MPSPRYKAEPRALTAAEIDALLDGYATAARHCREGGVDGIEVSMSHGYLIAQFFSPASNRRADAYAAPLRFAEQVLEAVRGGRGAGARGRRAALGGRARAGGAGRRAPAPRSPRALCATGLVDFASFVLGHSAYFAVLDAGSCRLPPAPAGRAGRAARRRAGAAVDVPVIGTTQVVDVAGRGAADRGRRTPTRSA